MAEGPGIGHRSMTMHVYNMCSQEGGVTGCGTPLRPLSLSFSASRVHATCIFLLGGDGNIGVPKARLAALCT